MKMKKDRIELEAELVAWAKQVAKENRWTTERAIQEILTSAHKKFEEG